MLWRVIPWLASWASSTIATGVLLHQWFLLDLLAEDRINPADVARDVNHAGRYLPPSLFTLWISAGVCQDWLLLLAATLLIVILVLQRRNGNHHFDPTRIFPQLASRQRRNAQQLVLLMVLVFYSFYRYATESAIFLSSPFRSTSRSRQDAVIPPLRFVFFPFPFLFFPFSFFGFLPCFFFAFLTSFFHSSVSVDALYLLFPFPTSSYIGFAFTSFID
mmetsp:Transcript_17019/g.35336  ORF Transcript_17019/g.35336 Transcript_17019/m.35336 type:complete len:218 (-) Transcript_17019:2656-3309(-)